MFKRPSIRYGKTPQAETPYQRAAQVWDEPRYGVSACGRRLYTSDPPAA